MEDLGILTGASKEEGKAMRIIRSDALSLFSVVMVHIYGPKFDSPNSWEFKNLRFIEAMYSSSQ